VGRTTSGRRNHRVATLNPPTACMLRTLGCGRE
jgi:hypothetical protein